YRPEPLLRGGERGVGRGSGALARCDVHGAGSDGAFAVGGPAGGEVTVQLRDGGVVEEFAQGDVGAEGAARRGGQTDGGQGVAAHPEEVVVDTHAGSADGLG